MNMTIVPQRGGKDKALAEIAFLEFARHDHAAVALEPDAEVVRRGDVRRAKLYYLRNKVGKAAKIKEKAYR